MTVELTPSLRETLKLLSSFSDKREVGTDFLDLLRKANDEVNSISGKNEPVESITSNTLSLFDPRSFISQLEQPFTNRCKKCGKVIEAGDYCPDCEKEVGELKVALSDERCKELRRRSIEKMKNGWGETDVMKKKKKEQQQNGNNK